MEHDNPIDQNTNHKIVAMTFLALAPSMFFAKLAMNPVLAEDVDDVEIFIWEWSR
jgi:hypothetical protein